MNIAGQDYDFIEARARRWRTGTFAAFYFAGVAVLAGLVLSEQDDRYRVLLLLLFCLGIALVFVPRKLGFLRNLLIFSISLRVLNANLGKRIPSLELAFPNLNISEIVLVACVAGLILRWIATGKRIAFPRSKAHTTLLALVGVFVFSLYFVTRTPEFGYDRFITVIEMYLTYLVIFNLVKTDRDVNSVVRVLVATMILEMILVASEIVVGSASPLFRFVAGNEALADTGVDVVAGRKIGGSFGDAVVFGWAMGFLYFFLLPFAVVEGQKGTTRRWLIVLSIASAFVFGLLTMTRTALFSEVVFSAVGIYLLSKTVDKNLWKWVPRLIAGGVIVLSLFLLIPGASRIFSARSADVEELSSSLDFRLVSWDVGWRILKEYPLFGLGVGSGGLLAYSADGLSRFVTSSEEETVLSYAGIHNGHAIMFAEMGIVGYATYIGMILFFLADGLRLLKRVKSNLDIQVGVAMIMIIGFLLVSDFTGVALAFRPAMNYVALSFALTSARLMVPTSKPLKGT